MELPPTADGGEKLKKRAAALYDVFPSAVFEDARSMCVLIAILGQVSHYPLIVAANRDESVDRPGTSPQLLCCSPSVWGGRDPRGGGTWLGVNEFGLIVAATNRLAPSHDPTRRSRGLLCLEALSCRNVAGAKELLKREIARTPYNWFNMFCADGREAFVLEHTGDPSPRLTPLEPGIHVLGNEAFGDLSSPKLRRARELAEATRGLGLEELLRRLQAICADHQEGVPPSQRICLHGDQFATLSSSILAIRPQERAAWRYFHLRGNPCAAQYEDFSWLFTV